MEPQRRLYVVLDAPDFRRLAAIAERERRDVRDQAAVMIARAIQPRRRRGADDPPTPAK